MWRIGGLLLAAVVNAGVVGAQDPANVCTLSTSEEFQRAYGIHPQIGLLPDTPEFTAVSWGQHCDFANGAIDHFTSSKELDRVLGLTKALKERAPVPGLGKRAFFTVVYPGDPYRERGLLAIDTGSRLLAISMDRKEGEPVATTRPKLEGLAKLVLPRVR
jgi:hypothetical protein